MDSIGGRLLLSKYLYTRGADILRAGGLFDAGLAVSLFQDAVELAVFSCGALFNAQTKTNADFMEIWRAADVAAIAVGKPALQMKADMQALNKVRVNFKHYGIRPDSKDAEAHRINCAQFLSLAAKDYFGLDFATLSLVSFVQEDRERIALEEALAKLQADDKRESLLKCSEALDLMRRRGEAFYQHGLLVSFPQIDSTTRTYIDQQISHLRSYVRDIEGLVFSGLYGVAPMDFMLLRGIVPTKRGDELVFEHWASDLTTNETVARCIEILAQYSIGMSDRQAAVRSMLPGSEYLF